MFRRFFYLVIVVVVLSSMLAACGDDKAASSDALPTYNGATSLNIPADNKTALQQGLAGTAKDVKVDGYKTGDATDKVKSSLADSFKKSGWEDKSADLASMGSSLPAGSFFMNYVKGDKRAVILGYPGSVAADAGVTGVSDKETWFVVVSATNTTK